MYVVTVEFTVRAESLSDFLPLMAENARASRDLEPGCVQFDVCQSSERLQSIFLYEVYEDAEAFQAHLKTSHFRAFDAATRDMIATKDVVLFRRLG